jgi:hypothetical protein
MTDTPNREWDDWQSAWRSEPSPVARTASLAAEMQRRLLRHRRAAWTYTALDICAAILLVGLAVYSLICSPTLPVVVWAGSIFLFTANVLGFAIWNRRDALFFSARSTTDFLAALRVRLDRRERMSRFLMRIAAAEIAFGLVFYAVRSPKRLAFAAALYGIIALVLTAWWHWHRRRLLRERAQLDALCGNSLA